MVVEGEDRESVQKLLHSGKIALKEGMVWLCFERTGLCCGIV